MARLCLFVCLLLHTSCFSQAISESNHQNTSDTIKPLLSEVVPASNLFAEKPRKWAFITNVPSDLWQIAKSPFQRKYRTGVAVVAVSSALLIWKDQEILDDAKRFGRDIHLHPETDYAVILKAGTTKIIKVPRNLNTALYQAGEGGTSMLLAGGLYLYGKIKKDNRALQTASDLAETFITMGIGTQLLKRSFGRQSPFMSTQPGGKWTPFPAFGEYQRNTSNYDGFPSGHIATLIATVTVLVDNYPEKKWLKPVGYLFTGLVSYAMMNTEVHWAGDYPLGLALGYVAGKITTNRHKQKKPAAIL